MLEFFYYNLFVSLELSIRYISPDIFILSFFLDQKILLVQFPIKSNNLKNIQNIYKDIHIICVTDLRLLLKINLFHKNIFVFYDIKIFFIIDISLLVFIYYLYYIY